MTTGYQVSSNRHELYGRPDSVITRPFTYISDRIRWGPHGQFIWGSPSVSGWIRGAEAVRLAQTAFASPTGAVIVELGSLLGCSTVLLAGARKLRGSGKVYCVDPFDASGDTFSVPIYEALRADEPHPLRRRFERNLARAGVSDWVEINQTTAEQAVPAWKQPIDLLLLDAHQSYEVVTVIYEQWHPFLKAGAILAIHNSRPGYRQESHDGSARLVEERIHPPDYVNIDCVNSMTFAQKISPELKAQR